MKTAILTTAAVFATSLFAGLASAQSVSSYGQGSYGTPYYAPAPGYGYGYGGYSSTLEEGYLRGVGAALEGAGQYNLLTSQAAINGEQARRMYMENRRLYAENYFELRRINSEARAAERGPQVTQEQIAAFARSRAPDRLAPYQYERAMGRLSWPATLASQDFDLERTAIDQLMADRLGQDHGLGTDNQREIASLVDLMQAKLKDRIREMSPAEYVAAKKFLTSVDYEAQLPLDTIGIAAE